MHICNWVKAWFIACTINKYSETTIHHCCMQFLPMITVHFFWCQKTALYFYNGNLILQRVIFPHQMFIFPSPNPQYTHKDHFWAKENSGSNMMFFQHTAAPYINLVWNEGNKMFLEHTVVPTCLYRHNHHYSRTCKMLLCIS